MAEAVAGTVNEFGTVTTGTDPAVAPLNQQGKETSLDDILAAITGKNVQTPAAPAPTAKATTPDPVDEATKAKFNTGNKALDVAVSSFVRTHGASDADIQRACQNALTYNDASLIDHAFLAERFKDKAGDAAAIITAVVEQAGVERDRLVADVYSTAGGEEQWKQALSVYKQHAQPGLQKAIQMMFDSGDAQSVKEAASLVVDYAKNSGVLGQAGQRVVAGAGPAEKAGLSAADFQAAIGQLNQSSRNYQQDYNKLFEMRRVGKALGK